MIVKNTTVQNKTKENKLSNTHIIPTHCIVNTKEVVEFLKSLLVMDYPKEVILFSVGCQLVRGNKNPNLEKFLSEYSYLPIDIQGISSEEFDLLGSIYQYLNSKKENLERGSFYTGHDIAKDFIYDLDFSNGQTILDPSCGSGSFLFQSNAKSNQIFGVDNDPIAIMIAKFNYFIKFPDAEYPNLFCDDFFSWCLKNSNVKFDYIIGNPPYGATLNLKNIPSTTLKSGESFSYFIEYGIKLLKPNGYLRFLLPESILNVKKHQDIRNFILNTTNLKRIKKYRARFSGVMSELYMLEIDLLEISDYMDFTDVDTIKIPKNLFKITKNNVLVYLTHQDISIIQKVNQLKGSDLSKSSFALGVVTGGNKNKLFDNPLENTEPIYTGKQVTKYKLLPPNKHIIYDRSQLQQVAPDEIYRTEKKLVYKTVNKNLKVAIDTTSSLTTNSANIIIPNFSEMDIYTVLGILNSNLYSYLNIKLFGGVNKVSKENLQNLPLPKISKKQNSKIKNLVLRVLNDGDDVELQKYIHEDLFKLTEEEIDYISNLVKD
jgi:hypothetical protein